MSLLFCVFDCFCSVDTYVYRDNCDWVNWRWDLLAEKLECFDLLGDIYLGEENNCQVHIDTNNFFTNLVNLYTRRVSYDEKVRGFVICNLVKSSCKTHFIHFCRYRDF